MIKANFNAYATYATDSLYQWDLNQVLSVTGLNLAVVPEVHFSNANMDRAIVRQATMVNHVVRVVIPNSLLQDPLTIHAHIGIYEGDTFKVVEKIEIPVIPKKRPIDYRIEDADEEIYSFRALENAIANMTTKVEANAISARIDNIVAHNNDTDGNTELLDIRVGLRNTYSTAGVAVRTQVNGLVDNIDSLATGQNINIFWRYANDNNANSVYNGNTGELISTYHRYSRSELIPVTPLEDILLYLPEPDDKCISNIGATFDEAGSLIGGMGMDGQYATRHTFIYTVPEDVYFVAINYHLDCVDETVVSPLRGIPLETYSGVTWACVGDSLTENNTRASKHYYDYVANDLGLSVLNYGMSSTGYKNGGGSMFYKRISAISDQFDVMTIFGSFNDLSSDWDLGNVTDVDDSTICGCINLAIEAFYTKFPTKKLAIITPTPWKVGINYFGVETTRENMEEYVAALIEIAKIHRLPLLDLYHYSGLNPDNNTVVTTYFNENGVQDVGVHPNSEGHKYIYPVIREFMKTICPRN